MDLTRLLQFLNHPSAEGLSRIPGARVANDPGTMAQLLSGLPESIGANPPSFEPIAKPFQNIGTMAGTPRKTFRSFNPYVGTSEYDYDPLMAVLREEPESIRGANMNLTPENQEVQALMDQEIARQMAQMRPEDRAKMNWGMELADPEPPVIPAGSPLFELPPGASDVPLGDTMSGLGGTFGPDYGSTLEFPSGSASPHPYYGPSVQGELQKLREFGHTPPERAASRWNVQDPIVKMLLAGLAGGSAYGLSDAGA